VLFAYPAFSNSSRFTLSGWAACWPIRPVVFLFVFQNFVDLQESVKAHHRAAQPEVIRLPVCELTAAIFAVVTSKIAGVICEAQTAAR